MSWTPKPGDKVTSPLLVGEWEYSHKYDSDTSIVRLGKFVAQVDTGALSPVAPPIPAEPPVGSVGRVDGKWFVERVEEGWRTTNGIWQRWDDIGPFYEPWVAVSQVADWLLEDASISTSNRAEAFVERFGWPDEKCGCSGKGPCYDHR